MTLVHIKINAVPEKNAITLLFVTVSFVHILTAANVNIHLMYLINNAKYVQSK